MSERNDERVGPIPSLTVAERVAFGAAAFPASMLGASDDVPSRWWGRSYVYGDGKPAEREHTAWH